MECHGLQVRIVCAKLFLRYLRHASAFDAILSQTSRTGLGLHVALFKSFCLMRFSVGNICPLCARAGQL